MERQPEITFRKPYVYLYARVSQKPTPSSSVYFYSSGLVFAYCIIVSFGLSATAFVFVCTKKTK